MNSFQKIVLFGLLNQLASLSCIEAHRCFVCIPSIKKKDHDVINLIKDFGGEKIRKCEEFSESERESFIKECPEDSVGCLTQLHGNSFLRSCARYGWDICREANNVTYCYCSKNECNTPESRLADPSSYIEDDVTLFTDDEVGFESSGDVSSTFVDSEDDYETEHEEEVTEFPISIVPHVDIDTNINEKVDEEEISRTSSKHDLDIVLTESFDYDEEEIKIIDKQEQETEVTKKPSDVSSSLQTLPSPFIILSISWIAINKGLLIY